MTLSAGLDASLAVGMGVVFFAVLWPEWRWTKEWSWWGMEVFKKGCDWGACTWKVLGEGEKFGVAAA